MQSSASAFSYGGSVPVAPLQTGPVMAPNYVYGVRGANPLLPTSLQFTERWNTPGVTSSCAASPDAASRCIDAVTRGALTGLTPLVGAVTPDETLFPDEVAYLRAAMAAANRRVYGGPV
jgi:hypothetical protein